MLTRSQLETIRVFTCHNAFISGGSIGQTRTSVRKVRKVRESYAEGAKADANPIFFRLYFAFFAQALRLLRSAVESGFDLGNYLKIHEKALCGSNYKGQALFKK